MEQGLSPWAMRQAHAAVGPRANTQLLLAHASDVELQTIKLVIPCLATHVLVNEVQI